MKATLIVLFLVWTFIKQGHSDRFEVKDNADQVCMIVELDATFQLSRESPRQDAPVFQLKDATIDTKASSCGLESLPSFLNMDLQPSNERLTLVFKKTDTDTVELNVFLGLRPLAHFPGADNATVGLEDGVPHMDVGKVTDSYMCMSEQSILFANGSYGMTMTISNVHLQAFNVQDGTFSPPIFCDLDDTSSVAPVSEMTSVTEATTSEAPVTTQAGTTQSIPAETTTVAPTTPPPVEHHFEVKDGDVVCIAMNATFVFHIPYNTTTGEAKTADIQVPVNATVTPASTCGNGNDTEQLLEIQFFNHEWKLAIRVGKDVTERDVQLRADDDFDYSWHSVELTYQRNDKHFPNIKDPSDEPVPSSSGAIDGEFKAHTNGSYRCTSKKPVALEDSISLDLANMQYKAFGVTDSDEFSGAVSECPTTTPGGDGSGRTIVIVVGATLGGLAVIALVAYILFRQKRKDNPAECPEDSGGDDDDDHTLAIALGAGLGGLALLIVVAVIIWKVRSSKRSGYKDLDKQPI